MKGSVASTAQGYVASTALTEQPVTGSVASTTQGYVASTAPQVTSCMRDIVQTQKIWFVIQERQDTIEVEEQVEQTPRKGNTLTSCQVSA